MPNYLTYLTDLINRLKTHQSSILRLMSKLIKPSLLITLCLICAMPLLWLIIGQVQLLGKNLDPDTQSLWQHIVDYQLNDMLINTLYLCFFTPLFSLIIGMGCAWWMHQFNQRYKTVLNYALILPLAIPMYVMAFSHIALFDYTGWLQTILRAFGINSQAYMPNNHPIFVAAVMSLSLYPYVYLLYKHAFASIGKQAIDLGYSFGFSKRKIFWKIIVPQTHPWLIASISLVLMETLADFAASSLFNLDTLTTGVYKTWFSLFSLPLALRLACLSLVFVVLLWLLERYARKQKRYTQINSPNTIYTRTYMQDTKIHHLLEDSIVSNFLNQLNKVALNILIVSTILLALVLPIAQLIVWALQSIKNLQLNSQNVWFIDLYQTIWPTVKYSIYIASITSFVVLIIALLLVWLNKALAKSWAYAWIALATIGYAIPGSVLAVASYSVSYPFSQWLMAHTQLNATSITLCLLIWAYVVRFIALGFAQIDSAYERLLPNYTYIAAGLGYSFWQSKLTIDLPLLKNSFIYVSLMVFIDTLKEVPITLMMRPSHINTLSTKLFSLTSEGLYQEAAIPALLLIFISCILLLTVQKLQTKK